MTMMVRAEEWLEDWDRSGWMQAHGVWASDDWEAERKTYGEVRKLLAEEVARLPEADEANDREMADEVLSLAKRLVSAAWWIDGAVRPIEEEDHIKEGTIDPDQLETLCDGLTPVAEKSRRGWDCVEGWEVYQPDSGEPVLHWYRSGYGQRRSRYLWVRMT